MKIKVNRENLRNILENTHVAQLIYGEYNDNTDEINELIGVITTNIYKIIEIEK